MKFIENPPQHKLEELQRILGDDAGVGFADIWATIHPYYMLIEENGKPIAAASMICLGDKAWELYKLYVVPGHRKKGLGAVLVNMAIKKARTHGIGTLHIEVVGESGAFWNKVLQGRDITDFGCGKYSFEVPLN